MPENKIVMLTVLQDKAFKMYREGLTQKQIADKLSNTPSAVQATFRLIKNRIGEKEFQKYNIRPKKKGRIASKVLTPNQTKVFKWYKKGLTQNQLAKKFSVSLSAIWLALQGVRRKIGEKEFQKHAKTRIIRSANIVPYEIVQD